MATKMVEYNGRMVETIDCTPTWTAAARIYLAAIENGNAEGIKAGRAGVMEMGANLDKMNAMINKLNAAGFNIAEYLRDFDATQQDAPVMCEETPKVDKYGMGYFGSDVLIIWDRTVTNPDTRDFETVGRVYPDGDVWMHPKYQHDDVLHKIIADQQERQAEKAFFKSHPELNP